MAKLTEQFLVDNKMKDDDGMTRRVMGKQPKVVNYKEKVREMI